MTTPMGPSHTGGMKTGASEALLGVQGLVRQAVAKVRYARMFGSYPLRVLAREAFLWPLDRYVLRAGGSSLLEATVFVTARCNHHCSFCNLRGHPELVANGPDPEVERVVEWLDRLRPHRPNIVLQGGEPMLRDDICEIVRAAKARGMGCGIYSNGSVATPERTRSLLGSGLDYIVISVHGSRGTHDRLCGSNAAFDRVEETLRSLSVRPRRTRVTLNCVLDPENLEDVEAVLRMVRLHGLDGIAFTHPAYVTPEDLEVLRDRGRSDEGRWACHLPPLRPGERFHERLQSLKDAIRRIRASGVPYRFVPQFDGPAEIEQWYQPRFQPFLRCLVVPWRSTNILPNGDVVPCEHVRTRMGNLDETPFDAIWHGETYREFRRDVARGKTLPSCIRCFNL